MHAELPAEKDKPKESLAGHLREAIAKLKPKDYTTKLFEELQEKETLFCREVRGTVNPEDKDLTLVYPASGDDIKIPLLTTGAKTLILIDMSDHSQDIIWEMKKMGVEVKKISSSENRTEIDFEWEGKSRRILFYKLTIESNALEKLPAEMKGGYDIYFEKKQIGIGHPRIQEEFIKLLRSGGFRVADKELENNLGFRSLLLGEKFESYLFDGVRLFVQQKNQQKPAIASRIDFNGLLSEAEEQRHGGYSGISGRWADQALGDYFNRLMRLKVEFDSFPKELQVELKPEIVERLYRAPGDMSKVRGTPQFWERLYNERCKARGRTPLENERSFYESEIEKALKHGPTEQQLERFIQNARGIFREVFKDWVF
jgi:hypothetical protein